jgi:cellulose synthase/poly-beta-1,6-N-acetylglucosamine synthase-like glycosyltransferase/peptidoglycan/xylan/chitin deacetylase (PgdA/CDA1 family)/spore germination protein YaaH
MKPDKSSVFLDPSGKRWRNIRRATLGFGILTTIIAFALVVSFLAPPILPNLQAAKKAVTGLPSARRTVATTRDQAARAAVKQKMIAALAFKPAPPGRHIDSTKVEKNRAIEVATVQRVRVPNGTRPGIVAGFFVNWDDNSLASFRAHAKDLDWVIGEWAFLAAGGDSLKLMPRAEVLYIDSLLAPKDRPRLFAMVSNFDTKMQRFDPQGVKRLLSTAQSRQRAALQLINFAQKFGLAGITVDFEEVPTESMDNLFDFLRMLRAGLTPGGRLLTTAISINVDEQDARRYAAANDYVFLMLYDEHYGRGEPGPIASQAWYAAKAKQFLQWIPPERTILALGAYGYHWNDAGGTVSPGIETTFQEAMQLARIHGVTPQFDSLSLTPYLRWSEPGDIDHVVWYLDGVTAWNQARIGTQLGVAGSAIWRLGQEDPSMWSAISNDVPIARPNMLDSIPPGYDVHFDGKGELLRLNARPSGGRRILRADEATGFIVNERMTELPSPWVVQRFGAEDSVKIALTFDDGPDAKYTPAILDTLKSRGVKATFFVIGRQADEYPNILRRIIREGHEIGNHTYTHPNLSLTSPFVTKLEIIGTGRLIETIISRRTALFRAPYFGDADPTTADELEPLAMATDLGYLNVGVRIDSQDWHLTDPDSILRLTLNLSGDGNIVLMHDSGGDRRATVAILGKLIDSLRVYNREPVLVSELAGITREEANPVLASRSLFSRVVDVVGFGAVGAIDWGLYWVFMAAVILGALRLVFIISMAAIQRWRRRTERPDASSFAPAVTVVVPAYNEEMVVVRTVESLLSQDYAGALSVIVVDDGSPDSTFETAQRAFAGNSRVRVLRKENGGKASALNYGIAHSDDDFIVALDADTQFEKQTVRALLTEMVDPHVGAVAGNAKVGNRINLVTRWQALEYVTSQNLDRRAFSLLDCISVIPGAVGSWRKSAIIAAGGFTEDTLAEDQDLTIRIRKLGLRIGFAETAVAWTEAPDTFGSLSKQRFRWSFGTLQCAWKHKHALLNPKYGTLGFIALPNTWLFQLLLTALSPLADLMFAFALLSVWLTWRTHGETYALTDLENVMTFYAIFLFTDWLGAMIAFLMEPDEERSLTWLIVLQRFAYRQIMYSVVVKSFYAAIRGRVVGWGRLERKATVELPV